MEGSTHEQTGPLCTNHFRHGRSSSNTFRGPNTRNSKGETRNFLKKVKKTNFLKLGEWEFCCFSIFFNEKNIILQNLGGRDQLPFAPLAFRLTPLGRSGNKRNVDPSEEGLHPLSAGYSVPGKLDQKIVFCFRTYNKGRYSSWSNAKREPSFTSTQ